MALKTGVSCLRIVQRQSRLTARTRPQTPRFTASRTLTTTCRRFAEPNKDESASPTPHTFVPPANLKSTGADAASKPTITDEDIEKASKSFSKAATGAVTGTYTAYGATEELYKECARHADYKMPQAQDNDAETPKTEEGEDLGVGEGWWHTELGLSPTFSTWSQVTMLHLYLLTVRFRCFEPAIAKVWQQHILDHFFYDAENKMAVNHGMHASGTRARYLKDLFIQWRGVLAAYDEGLAKNDAVLASALWRNVFKAREDVDIKRLAQIVSYMRRTLAGLDAVDDTKVMMAEMIFGSPESESGTVALKSKLMDAPFDKTSAKPSPTKPLPENK